MFSTVTLCPICAETKQFVSVDSYQSCRDGLYAPDCPLIWCATRERAAATALFSIFDRETIKGMAVHDVAPADRGISRWLRQNVVNLVVSGYYPGQPFGDIVDGLRNEDLEAQTFQSEIFDVVLHLDVMEHMFDPFQALKEIWRTLRPTGVCLFTTPTYEMRSSSEQVAFKEADGIRIVGEPEYHGNPQDDAGSLVTWRYGYDLPRLIFERVGFDVEVRRWQAAAQGVMGPMTEVYILRKAK